ncbi:metalloendoproteinase 1-like [Apium graveolens]|uniref:metalloendoproteinase 1-like n=1 Tax=Apium graveolens TaxID=4045 RepID=UPI003D79F4CC
MAAIVWFCITLFIFIFNASAETASASEFLNNFRGSRKGANIEGISELKKHLHDIGYISSDSSNANITSDGFDDLLESALKKYQSYYNLNVTGVVDDDTLSLMSQPRCGVPDFPDVSPDFSLYPGFPKWWTYNLSYSFAPYTRGDAFDPVARAMENWAYVSPFRFTLIAKYMAANFKISFVQKDGPGKILASAYKPRDGRLLFDEAEKWVNGKVSGGYDMQSVALHEIGHLLGLRHSKDPNAVMYAYLAPNNVKTQLQADDILGLKALYDF